MRASDFDFQLPTHLIAQSPAPQRDQSRLLVLQRDPPERRAPARRDDLNRRDAPSGGSALRAKDRLQSAPTPAAESPENCKSAPLIEPRPTLSHHRFQDLPQFLSHGDLLVLNDSKVIPARLRANHSNTGSLFEILLLEETALNNWWAMMRPGKRAPLKTQIEIKSTSGTPSGIHATVVEINSDGHRRLHFSGCKNILDELNHLGEVPLPPYIKRAAPSAEDVDRYQTIYAHSPGSVAAPTAGLHFTPALLDSLRAAGIETCHLTLHVGPGTFAPVKVDDLEHHTMHEERFVVSEKTADQVNRAKADGRRVIAIGTTSVRVLESVAATNNGRIVAGLGRTLIFIHPPHRFQIVDALLTNFHLPRSTLLMLVSAFASPGDARGRDLILRAYQEAIERRYRFFSYGDAMLIL